MAAGHAASTEDVRAWGIFSTVFHETANIEHCGAVSLIRNGASAGRPGPLTYTCER